MLWVLMVVIMNGVSQVCSLLLQIGFFGFGCWGFLKFGVRENGLVSSWQIFGFFLVVIRVVCRLVVVLLEKVFFILCIWFFMWGKQVFRFFLVYCCRKYMFMLNGIELNLQENMMCVLFVLVVLLWVLIIWCIQVGLLYRFIQFVLVLVQVVISGLLYNWYGFIVVSIMWVCLVSVFRVFGWFVLVVISGIEFGMLIFLCIVFSFFLLWLVMVYFMLLLVLYC